MDPQSKIENRKSKKWPWWILGVGLALLMLVAGLRLALKNDWLLDWVRDLAVEQVNEQLHGTLAIESIRGDLIRGFVIRGIHLKDAEHEDILFVDSVSVDYQLRSLLRPPHQLDDLSIYGADVVIRQDTDSTWNMLKLVKEADEPEPVEVGDPVLWSVEQLKLDRGRVSVYSDSLLPDGFVVVNDLKVDLTTGMGNNGFYGTLRALDFSLEEARLPEPVQFAMTGSGSEEMVTLETLVINTGRTLLNSRGGYEEEGTLYAEAEMIPVSWRDVAAYVEDLPLQQDIQMSVGLEGDLTNLNLSLQASASGLARLLVQTGINLEDEPLLTSLEIELDGLDAPLLTGIEDSPILDSLRFTGKGHFKIDDWDRTNWAGDLTFAGLSYDEYQIDTFTAIYALTDGNAEFSGEIVRLNEQIDLQIVAEQVMSEEPAWSVELFTSSLNLAVWLNDDALDSQLNIRADANGVGIDPEAFSSEMNLLVLESRFGDQHFSELSMTGTLNPADLTASLSGRLDESIITFDFNAENWAEDHPEYRFEVFFHEVNLAEIAGFSPEENLSAEIHEYEDEFSTSLNGSLIGEGSSFDPESLKIRASVNLDSSMVNRELLQHLRTEIQVEDQILYVNDFLLNSPIADMTASLRQRLTDPADLENRLQFHGSIKDLQPLAHLAGLEQLAATGSVEGRMMRSSETGLLEFDGTLDLEEVLADTLFRANRILGSAKALVVDQPEIDLRINLIGPAILEKDLQDIEINTLATITEQGAIGEMEFLVFNDTGNLLSHQADFRIDSTSVWLQTNILDFKTEARSLGLSKPFEITYANDVLRVDTLTVRSDEEDTWLTLWAPHIDSLRQQFGLRAHNLNLGVLQTTVVEEAFFEGSLSGDVNVKNHPDTLEVSASALLAGFAYGSGEMDSLRITTNLKDDWLDAEIDAWHREENLIRGEVRVPFLPGDPRTFEDQFFDRTISGRFQITDSDLMYWLSFLPENEIEETGGRISFESNLSGSAGSPGLNGELTVREAIFSGVAIDTVATTFLYSHEAGNIELKGGIQAEQRSVLNFEVLVPFLVDLKEMEVVPPGEEEVVFAEVNINSLDLALFENYLDREVMRQLRGRLDGEFVFSGPLGELEGRGEMRLGGGSVRVVPAGITLDEMESRIVFDPERIDLQKFTMRSGPGRINANGSVEMENLTPGAIQLNIRGNQFRVANTREYNALVNLNTSLDGTVDQPRISGSLTFLEGYVNLQNFGDYAVEDVRLEEEEEEEETAGMYDSLAMEMNVSFSRQFFIRSRQYLDMEFELGGEVDLLKEPNEELQLFGALEGVRGYARPLGKLFQLDEAVVSFYGPADDPELAIRTRYEPPQAQSAVRIFYIIEGTAQDPSFRFDSEPELELQDMISYTLFGRPFYELDSWEQIAAGGGGGPNVTDMALDVLLDRVEMLASGRFGIDVIQIENSRSGSNSTTSIKTGWYLNRRTFFAILNEISTNPKTLFLLEYLLRENLELIVVQGDDSREGIDLRWRYDY